MTHIDPDQLRALFDQALDLESEARTAFMAELRENDPATWAELKPLLNRFEQDHAFFDKPIFPNLADALKNHEWSQSAEWDPEAKTISHDESTAPIAEPTRIGPYPVIKKIGEGGMGSVYLVRQLKPGREVALKLIKRLRVSDEFLSRFESENRVLALMNHHNIARIYEVGATEDDDPYFTMEYVDGIPITQYCIDHAVLMWNFETKTVSSGL